MGEGARGVTTRRPKTAVQSGVELPFKASRGRPVGGLTRNAHRLCKYFFFGGGGLLTNTVFSVKPYTHTEAQGE